MTAPVQLPAVPWLFIHGQPGGIGRILLTRNSARDDDVQVDSEGRWEYGEVETVDLRGYAAMLSEEEAAWADSRQHRVHAVVACPRGTVVDGNDEVVLAAIDRYLDGRYTVEAVRSTPVHVRVLLRRWEAEGG